MVGLLGGRPISRMSKIVFKIITWLAWLSVVELAILMAHYWMADASTLHRVPRPFDVFTIGMFLIPVLFCGSFRFWLSRIRNPWLALFPFLGGLFFAWQAELFGIFIFPWFYVVFRILSAVLFLAYLPVFVRLRETPPPINVL